MSFASELVVVSQNTLVREGLLRVVEKHAFDVIQSADSVSELRFESERGDAPFILLIDADDRHFQLEHIQIVRKKFPQARVALFSDGFDFDTMVKAFRLGAYGYCVKQLACEPLVGSLQLIAMGEKVMPSQLANELPFHTSDFYPANGNKSLENADLTEREVEILQCLIMGCPNKVISRHLDITEATVKVHVKAILRKLQVQNRTQAAIWAVNHGLEGLGGYEGVAQDDEPDLQAGLVDALEEREMVAA